METSEAESEADWIRQAQAGDVTAFPRLVRLHGATLLRGAMALCRDHQLAEDIVQETLVEAWRSLTRFDGRCRFSTWLYGILRHRHLKAAARHWRANLVELSSDDSESCYDKDSDPSLASQLNEDLRRVRQSVASLPEGQRLAIELRFFADASLEDIAAALDIPLGTVKSRLHHGLENMRKQQISLNLFAESRESMTRKP
jgi:RNA polymerase sigma-70 factor (ECF subfamily)